MAERDETKQAWNEVASEFSGLGLKLKLHLEAARADRDAQDDVGHRVVPALDRLARAIDDAFDAVGEAAKDEAVREDVRKVGRTLSDALGATFSEVGDDLNRFMERKRGDRA